MSSLEQPHGYHLRQKPADPQPQTNSGWPIIPSQPRALETCSRDMTGQKSSSDAASPTVLPISQHGTSPEGHVEGLKVHHPSHLSPKTHAPPVVQQVCRYYIGIPVSCNGLTDPVTKPKAVATNMKAVKVRQASSQYCIALSWSKWKVFPLRVASTSYFVHPRFPSLLFPTFERLERGRRRLYIRMCIITYLDMYTYICGPESSLDDEPRTTDSSLRVLPGFLEGIGVLAATSQYNWLAASKRRSRVQSINPAGIVLHAPLPRRRTGVS